MVITVREASGEPVWKSPDGNVSIYEIVDSDGNKWSTMSHKIGKGAGQSFDVEVNTKNGKTYLRLPPDANSPFPQRKDTAQPAVSTPNANDIGRFAEAVDKFSAAVDRLVKAQTFRVSDTGDVVPTQLDNDAAAAFLGGEIVDDGEKPPIELYEDEV